MTNQVSLQKSILLVNLPYLKNNKSKSYWMLRKVKVASLLLVSLEGTILLKVLLLTNQYLNHQLQIPCLQCFQCPHHITNLWPLLLNLKKNHLMNLSK